MTAPDPGLADLIAAHREGDYGRFGRQTCECGWTGDSHPAHLALVVEQHTNGRIAELEAEIVRQKALVKWFDGLATSAERTIARVNALKVNLFRRGGFIITKWEAARLVRAALEGEKQ